MPHTYPIEEVRYIMQSSEQELQKLLSSTPYALKSNGILQVFGQAKHIPHIRIQVFLSLLRLGKLDPIPDIQLQPYLFALLMLHSKWLEPLCHKFFPKKPAVSDFDSQYELSLYLKMGGGTHWTVLRDSDFLLLPNDLSKLVGIKHCIISKNWNVVSKKLSTLPNPFSLVYFSNKKTSIQLDSLRCSKATFYNVKLVGKLPIDLKQLSYPFSFGWKNGSSPLTKLKNTEYIEVLDVGLSDISESNLDGLLQMYPNVHTLYICGTPNLYTLPKIVREREIKIYAFASACCTPDTNYDAKIRTLLFGKAEESKVQGKELLEALGIEETPSTVRIKGQDEPYQCSSLYEGFIDCQSTLHNRPRLNYSYERNIGEHILQSLCFSLDPQLFKDWSWKSSITRFLGL
jgi:hypothetical protein